MSDQRKYSDKLNGKRIVIFGGSSGLGYAAAEAAIEAGASVIISSSQTSRIEASVARLVAAYPSARSRVTGYPCDLKTAAVRSQISTFFDQVGEVDHIIYTAGDELVMDPVREITYERLIQAGQIRFVAPMMVASVGVGFLKKSAESSITFTAGILVDKPRAGWSVPAAWATGMIGMTRGLAVDLVPVRVNLVSPGAIETEMWKWEGKPEEEVAAMREMLGKENLTGRLGSPEDIAVSTYACEVALFKANLWVGGIFVLLERLQHDRFASEE